MTGSRRRFLALSAGLAVLPLAGCDKAAAQWHADDVTGELPPLAFTMTDASTGREVGAADFRGKVALLYFGYTMCPDLCPATLANLVSVLQKLGDRAKDARVLFVTVDPGRDTPEVMKRYTAAFSPRMVGLRGTPDQIAALARRYRVAYSVTPAAGGHPYAVTHSSVVYVFDRAGRARLLVSSMAGAHPDIGGTAADLRRLLRGDGKPSLLQRVLAMV